jgi:hypothetical protein
MLEGASMNETVNHQNYFTMNNHVNLCNSEVWKLTLIKLDEFLAPHFNAMTTYDFHSGTDFLPFTKHTFDARYWVLIRGSISVQAVPYTVQMQDSFVDTQHIPQDISFMNNPYMCMEWTANAGDVVFVPPHWWMRMRFLTTDKRVISVTYHSWINILANSKLWMKTYLQTRNARVVPAQQPPSQMNDISVETVKTEDVTTENEIQKDT